MLEVRTGWPIGFRNLAAPVAGPSSGRWLAPLPCMRYPDSCRTQLLVLPSGFGGGLVASEDSHEIPKPVRAFGGVSLVVALLQSVCTAVFAVSGIRLVIGLTALAAVSGVYAPARGWHQDAIRIPMLIFAAVGAVVNLAVLGWIWRLRSQGSAQWRRRELTKKQRRSERLQVALAIVTLILVGLETWTHTMIHRTGPPPVVHDSAS